MAIHKVFTSPISSDGTLTHRSECDTCGTVLALHARQEDAENHARTHAIEHSGLLEARIEVRESIIQLDLERGRRAVRQEDKIRRQLQKAGVDLTGVW